MQETFFRTKLNNIINVNKIVTIHYFEFTEHFNFAGEKHDFWEMVYIDKGTVSVKGGKDENVLSQGEIIFHKPNEFHSIKAYNSSPNFFVISFVCNSSAMKYFEKYHTVLNKNLRPFIKSIINESEKAYIIPKNQTALKKLELRQTIELGAEQLIKINLEQLLIMLLRDMTAKKETAFFPSKESFDDHVVNRLEQYVDSHLQEKITVKQICDAIGYSKSYIYKLFSEQCNDSIASFINKKKIEKAKHLIQENAMNFSEIANYLCFDNPQYFSRVFKRYEKMTPSDYKSLVNK